MSTPLTDKIQALTAYANEITGESDTTLSDAVASLASGYGQGGGGGSEDVGVQEPLKDVVFVDYDGEIVQQYTKAEFLALSAMPANPSHIGLVAQGWNWTLADAKAHVQTYGVLCIGQNYTTSDGKTRLYITVTDLTIAYPFEVNFYASVKGGVTVNWGDGTSTTSTAGANSFSNLTHTYATTGDYIITLEVTSGTASLGYNGSGIGCCRGNSTGSAVSATNLTAVEIGNSIVQIHKNAFRFHPNLKTFSVSTSVQTIGSGTTGEVFTESTLKCFVVPSGVTALQSLNFNGCTQLKFLPVPKSLTSLGNNAIGSAAYCDSLRMFTTGPLTSVGTGAVCYGCNKLEIFSVPGTFTTANGGYCRENHLLKTLTIPASVTTLADYSCTNLYGLREMHMLPSSPPTVVNARALPGNTYVTFYVPYSADHSILDAYKAADKWSARASQIQEEPQ